jgi:hypothetical protein
VSCKHCKYWVHGEAWAGCTKLGSCHRNAPQASLGDWHYEVLRFLWMLVSDKYKRGAKNPEDWEMRWEEAHEQRSYWPQTRASDWCGEFMEGEQMEKRWEDQ